MTASWASLQQNLHFEALVRVVSATTQIKKELKKQKRKRADDEQDEHLFIHIAASSERRSSPVCFSELSGQEITGEVPAHLNEKIVIGSQRDFLLFWEELQETKAENEKRGSWADSEH
jgi:hypothetical protein